MISEQFSQQYDHIDQHPTEPHRPANRSNQVFQNLITYELHRCSTSGGFGFDLKGDRPAIIGSVRKGFIAEKAGLKEGDLVISINNKKVTDLDHDQVVRHIGLSKNRLILQVTKLAETNIDGKSQKKSASSHSKSLKQGKKTNCKKLKNSMPTSLGSLHDRVPFLKPNVPPPPCLPPPALKQRHKMHNNRPVEGMNMLTYLAGKTRVRNVKLWSILKKTVFIKINIRG